MVGRGRIDEIESDERTTRARPGASRRRLDWTGPRAREGRARAATPGEARVAPREGRPGTAVRPSSPPRSSGRAR
eukprot:24187-Pelagococcus_subviridis.AAC.9